MLDTPENVSRFKKLLPRGSQAEIARRLRITEATVSQSLNKLDPHNRVVQEAVRIAMEAQQGKPAETKKMLENLLNTSEPATVQPI